MAPRWSRDLLKGRPKTLLREAICAACDSFDAILGRSDALTPPCRLRVRVGCFLSFIRAQRFRDVGMEFASHLRSLANLGPGSILLDLGCGCGQIASAVSDLLVDGQYQGIDPDQEAVDWCSAHISKLRPQFHFQSIDLSNGYYNPTGKIDPTTWRFPFEPETFDVVLLKSVFTHIMRPDMEHYLSEIARVLRRGGRCLASAYVINDEVLSQFRLGHSDIVLTASIDGGLAFDANIPEYILGWNESTLREAADSAGLRILEPIHFGSWCGRSRGLSYQDLVVFERPAAR